MTVNTTECGLYLEAQKEQIFAQWEELANEKLKAASNAPDLIVRNYLPYFLANLVSELKAFELESGSDIEKINNIDFDAKYSDEHGRSRASVARYTVAQVIQEYSLLRQVLRSRLYDNNILCLTTAEIIDRFIETSCAQAAQQFANSLDEVQEKLISVIAHDLRNPISVARSYVEIGELGLSTSDKVFGSLKRSLERALKLISELLDTTQLEAGRGMTFRFEQKDMVKELGVATNEAQEVYDNPIRFTTELETAHVVCDHMSILRVIENLISNGIKYGSVESPITLSLKKNTDEILISVHNEGSYIEPEQQNSMFEFLSRHTGGRDQRKEGWGLGLYLVRLVAKAHKGKAWIESDRDTGTTFCISIKNEAHPPGSAFSEYT